MTTIGAQKSNYFFPIHPPHPFLYLSAFLSPNDFHLVHCVCVCLGYF